MVNLDIFYKKKIYYTGKYIYMKIWKYIYGLGMYCQS